MELNLEELRRACAAAPDNMESQSELVRALMRSGLESEALDLERARFHCSIPWGDHKLTDRSSRECRSCERSVSFVSTLEELRQHAHNGDCIVAPEDLVDAFYLERCLSGELNNGPRCLGSMAGVRGDLTELVHYPEALPAMAQRPCFVFMVTKDQEDLSPELRTVILLELYPSHKNMVELLTESLGVKEVKQQFISEPELRRLYQARGSLFPGEGHRDGVGDFFGV